jgi:hypothetical protein
MITLSEMVGRFGDLLRSAEVDGLEWTAEYQTDGVHCRFAAVDEDRGRAYLLTVDRADLSARLWSTDVEALWDLDVDLCESDGIFRALDQVHMIEVAAS